MAMNSGGQLAGQKDSPTEIQKALMMDSEWEYPMEMNSEHLWADRKDSLMEIAKDSGWDWTMDQHWGC